MVLTSDGIKGDRVVHVAGARGPLTGRTRHGLLTLRATTGFQTTRPESRVTRGSRPRRQRSSENMAERTLDLWPTTRLNDSTS